MIQEAILHVENSTRSGMKLVPLPIDDPRAKHFDNRGVPITVPIPFPPRRLTVNTIESFVLAMKEYPSEMKDSLWVQLSSVVGMLDDEHESHRLDRVTLPLSPHSAFKTLAAAGEKWMEQKRIIDLFRHELADCAIDPDNTLPVLRNLKMEAGSITEGKYDHTSAKLGKTVSAQVTGADTIPEIVTVEFHPYPALHEEIDTSIVVTCTLFVDAAEGKLRLSPQPGELELAEAKARIAVRDTLKKLLPETPAFVGSPS